jgi:hypothetical protein
MAMRRKEILFVWCLAAGIAVAGAALVMAPTAEAGSRVAVGVGNSGFHSHGGTHPRIGGHRGFGVASPRGSGILPPLGAGIVPPLGPGIVPPLVSGQGRFDRKRFRHFGVSPFGLSFGSGVFIDGIPGPADPSAQMAAPPRLPPPQPDFQPHVITLEPDAAPTGHPWSVVILRPGHPDEVKTFGATAR